MHYHIDMKTQGMSFVEPFNSAGWNKSVTLRKQVNKGYAKLNVSTLACLGHMT